MNQAWIYRLCALVGVLLLLLVLNGLFPGALRNQDSQIGLVHGVALLSVLVLSMGFGDRVLAREAVRNIALWAGIALVFLTGYAYRYEIANVWGRVTGEITPTSARNVEPGVVELRRADNGHFIADARVNGKTVRFLVDTGATGIALSPGDARRIGLDLDALAYNQPVSTANGRTFTARVRLNSVRVGDIEVRGLAAGVHRDGLNESLLGMSFLNQLDGFEVSQDRLILRQY